MKPAQIRVFDGLRLTTDHVNHLQGALASGFEDFREILGVGRAQFGLGVSIADDGTATIQPGVAFDQQKNRLACDAPLTLAMTFGPQDTNKFICLKYEQVEDNPVEGHPTMIWDSCSALVRDALPDPKENLVTLAKVVKGSDGKLHLHEAKNGFESDICVEITAPDEPALVSPASPGTIPPPAIGSTATDTGAAAQLQPSPAGVPTPAPAMPMPVAVKFRQGIIQLASDPNAAPYFHSVVAPAMRAKIGANAFDLVFTLAQMDVTPDIDVAGFTTHSVLSGEFVFPVTGDAAPPHHAFECVSSGEVTVMDGGLAQFASLSINMYSVPLAQGTIWPASDLTGRGVSEFAFTKWSAIPEALRPPFASDLLGGFTLVAQFLQAAKGFTFMLKLLWSGKVSEDSVKALETQTIPFTWQVMCGWKATGS